MNRSERWGSCATKLIYTGLVASVLFSICGAGEFAVVQSEAYIRMVSTTLPNLSKDAAFWATNLMIIGKYGVPLVGTFLLTNKFIRDRNNSEAEAEEQ